MKKLLLLLGALISINTSKAQVVFCPPGAEWNYSFLSIPQWGGVFNYQNETVKYVGDSIIAGDTLKMLSNIKFYLSCENSQQQHITFLKQKGDTVFFKNIKTQNGWQILFNFACAPGSGWQTTILNKHNTLTTYSYTVDSVKTISINNHNLKVLVLGSTKLTERFGWNSFLFNYDYSSECDGFYYANFLCYRDTNFGVKTFTDKACGFSGVDGLREFYKTDLITIYPNPFNDKLNIEIQNAGNQNLKLDIFNSLGQLVYQQNDVTGKQEIDLNFLTKGIYYLKLRGNSEQNVVKVVRD